MEFYHERWIGEDSQEGRKQGKPTKLLFHKPALIYPLKAKTDVLLLHEIW